MTEYYVDNSQTGGNGLTPTSAFTSLTSIAWANGDIAWLRRSHIESLAHDRHGFAVWSANGFNQAAFAIGWPDVGDPFYETRPQAGIDASWDNDLPATETYSVYGYKFPTISVSATSVNTSHVIGRNMHVVNIALNLLNGSNVFPGRSLGAKFNNVLITRQGGEFGGFGALAFPTSGFEKIIIPHSVAGATGFVNATDAFQFGHLVFPPRSHCGYAGLFGQNAFTHCSLLEIQSNSIGYIIGNITGADPNEMTRIERVIGNEPCFDVATGASSNVNRSWATIDDYYGLGSVIWNGGGKPNVIVCKSADAMHDGSRATRFFTNSAAGAAESYGDSSVTVSMLMRKLMSVTSGTAINIRVPIYIGTTAVLSASILQIRAALRSKGGGAKHANSISPGSYTNWSGNFISGGSAWLAHFSWTPTETGNVAFEVMIPAITQATSGEAKVGYALFAEPYSV